MYASAHINHKTKLHVPVSIPPDKETLDAMKQDTVWKEFAAFLEKCKQPDA